MAAAVQKENVIKLTNGDTFNGPANFHLLIVAGSATATVALTVNGVEMVALSAVTGDSRTSPCIHIGAETVTVVLTGTGAKAYAVLE